MEFLRLAEGLVLIVAAISLRCSEPHTIEVHTSTASGFDKPFRWKCMANDTLNIVLEKNYKENINWNLAMEVENECQLKFASMQLRKYKGDCIDSITFAYSNKTDTLCRSATITTPKGKNNISITVRTGTTKFWQSCWWNSNYCQGGFFLTLLGVSLNQTMEATPTKIPENEDTSETVVRTTEADDEDHWGTSWQWQLPNCTNNEPFNDTTHNSTDEILHVVIDCKDDSKQLITESELRNQSSMEWIKKVTGIIMSNVSQCIEWCDFTVPNITDPPILYLSETRAITVDLKSNVPYLISCDPAGGTWATTPSCQGFKYTSAHYTPPAEHQDLTGIVSGAVVGVIAATIILVAIVLIVRRKSQSATKRGNADGFVEHGDTPIEMEDNPVYG